MVTLKNETLTVQIAELGAEMKSILCGDREIMWDGNPEVWSGTAPLMFPICGGLKDNRYELDGKIYSLPRHGYARTTVFEVEKAERDTAVFLHKSNEETKKVYPFDYELRVIYSLEEKTVKIEYALDNLSDKTMYFNIGSHEAYSTPHGVEDYDVIFAQEETLSANILYGNILSDQLLPIIKDSKVLPIYDKYFTIDALVFKTLQSRAATLRDRKTGRGVRVEFPDARYFLLWHKPGAAYLCMEPWTGIADTVGSSYDITQKEGIDTLAAGQSYHNTHTITVVEA